MVKRDPKNTPLTPEEISAGFGNTVWADRFPPILNVRQAAELALVPVKTIYDWSSRGLLRGCANRRGKHLRFWRDRYIHFLFNPNEN